MNHNKKFKKTLLVRHLNRQLRKEERKSQNEQNWNKLVLLRDVLAYLDAPAKTTADWLEELIEKLSRQIAEKEE